MARARVETRRKEVHQAYAIKNWGNLVRGRNATLYSPHLLSGFLRCGVCGGSMTIVASGHGSPRYGCIKSWKSGKGVCSNRLTVRAGHAECRWFS